MEWVLIVFLVAPSGNIYSFKESFPTQEICELKETLIRRVWDPKEYVDSWCDTASMVLKLTHPQCTESYDRLVPMHRDPTHKPRCISI